jgi:hypothetical protein
LDLGQLRQSRCYRWAGILGRSQYDLLAQSLEPKVHDRKTLICMPPDGAEQDRQQECKQPERQPQRKREAPQAPIGYGRLGILSLTQLGAKGLDAALLGQLRRLDAPLQTRCPLHWIDGVGAGLERGQSILGKFETLNEPVERGTGRSAGMRLTG